MRRDVVGDPEGVEARGGVFERENAPDGGGGGVCEVCEVCEVGAVTQDRRWRRCRPTGARVPHEGRPRDPESA